MAEQKTTKRNPWRIFRLTAVLFVIVFVLFVVVRVYFSNAQDNLTKVTAQALHLPVAFVSHNPITFNQYYARTDLVEKLNNKALTKEERNSVVDGLINDAIIKKLLAEKNIQVTDSELNEYFEYLKKVTFTDNSERYRLAVSDNDLKKEIVLPELRLIRLETEYAKDKSLNSNAHTLADLVTKMLKNKGDFAALAKQYSQDPLSAEIGGEMGFVDYKDIVPEVYAQLSKLKKNEVTVISSRFGLHVVELLNTDNKGPEGSARYDFRQIYLKSADFEKWFQQEQGGYTITKLR